MKFVKYLPFLLALLALSTAAYASPVTLTTAQITGFTFNAGASTPGTTGSVAPVGTGAAFSADFASDAGGTGVFDSAAGLGIAVAAGDVFNLEIMNSNANPWTWTVELFDAANKSLGMASVAPTAGNSAIASIVLAAAGTIDHVRISVSGAFQNDINGDANIFPAPEPATLMLLGMGLLGLPLLRKLKAN